MPSSVAAEATSRPRIRLGSASPRRRALLESIGLAVDVIAASTDEVVPPTGQAGPLTAELARAKFEAVAAAVGAKRPEAPLLAADTLVALGDRLLAKPTDRDHAHQVLAAVSQTTLEVVTSIWVGHPGDRSGPVAETVTTLVKMAAIDDDEIAAYLDTEDWADKAGGLALQGHAGRFVASVHGCWSNVIGLPLCAATRLLRLDPDADCHPRRCGEHRPPSTQSVR